MSNSVLLEDVGPGEELPGFDIDDPVLPPDIAAKALRSGGYPYDKRMKRKEYREQVEPLQVELVKLQRWVERQSQRIVIIFEGRDAAGKGGTINKFTQHLNPRHARAVALAKPDEVERALRAAWGAAPMEELDELDPEPAAVTPTSQVHRGELDGAPVAVKVLRPGVAASVRQDLALLEGLRFGEARSAAQREHGRRLAVDARDLRPPDRHVDHDQREEEHVGAGDVLAGFVKR